jgi:hypothetical protein
MANTKKLDRPARKASKRVARRKLKGLYAGMTPEERSKYAQAIESKPGLGLKKFVTDARKAAAKAAES